MSKKLYVGNLPFSFRDEQLNAVFAQFGAVTSAKVIVDRASGRSKGFGFVEMSNDGEADAAIASVNGSEQDGRRITVAEARAQEEGGPRGGGGGGGRGGFNRGGGGGGGGGGRPYRGGGGGGRRDGGGDRY